MRKTRPAVIVLMVLSGGVAISTIAPRERAAGLPANKNEVERGRYLVEEVAKCPECHTPRNARGELEHDAWLRGAPIWIQPVTPNANWAVRAPALAASRTSKRNAC